MEDIYKIFIGIVVLILSVFIGDIIRSQTMDEQKMGRKYFFIIITIGLIMSFLGLFLGHDWMLFTFAFITIVTSRSLK